MPFIKTVIVLFFSLSVYHSKAADLQCTPANQVVNLGVLQEGISNDFNASKDGYLNYFTCTVNRDFLIGASLSYTVEGAGGPGSGLLSLLAYGKQVPAYQANKATALCIGPYTFACDHALRKNTAISFALSYRVLTNLSGTGTFVAKVNLYQTPRILVAQSEQIASFYYIYTIAARPCSVADKNLAVNFSDLDNRLTDNPNRELAVTVNCPARTNVDVQLNSGKEIVNAAQGLSKTSLAGLNMQVYQNGYPVVLNQASTQVFQQGVNTYRLNFFPRLSNSAAPTGSFSADYTLTFDYK